MASSQHPDGLGSDKIAGSAAFLQSVIAEKDGDKSQERASSSPQDTVPKPTWRHLFAFTGRQHLGVLISAIACALVVAAAKTSYAVILGSIFNIVNGFGSGTATDEDTMGGVTTWCIILTAIGAGIWIANAAFMALWVIFGELVARSARTRLLQGLLARDIAWFDQREEGVGSLMGRMQTQTRELQTATSQVFGFLVSETVISIACMIVAFCYSWQLTLVLLATIPISVLALNLASRGLETAIEAQKRELGQASKYVVAAISAIDLVKTYNGFDHEIWQYLRTMKKAMGHYLLQARANALQMGYVKLWVVNLFVVGFWFAVYLIDRGLATPGNALTTFYAALTAFGSVENVGPQWLVLVKGMSAGHELSKIASDISENHNGQHKVKGSVRLRKFAGDIEFRNVTFAYPSNPSKVVLSHCNFLFPAGEMSFLVGRSGSGKSTLGNLLLKFYDSLSGQILIDGRAIETLDENWLRSNVTLIQQSSVLFNDSFFNNVAFGHVNPESVTAEQVKSACETALLQSTVINLPNGLDTSIGLDGYNLSGGQKQRLALARARLRDPPVLILDEITTGLDPISRALIMEVIRVWRRGKTTIIITHDVNQILNEDYVYVLDSSRLVQEGFRRDLVEDEAGMFASLLAAMEAGADVDGPRVPLSPVACVAANESESECSSPSVGVPTSRLSMFIPQTDGVGADPSGGGLFQRLTLGQATQRASIMRAREIWESAGRDTELKIDDEPVLRRSRSAVSTQNLGKLQDDDSDTLPSPRSARRLSIDIVQERGESTQRRARLSLDRNRMQTGQTMLRNTLRKQSTASSYSISNAAKHDLTKERRFKKTSDGDKPRVVSMFKILGTLWPILDRANRIRLVLGLCACLVAAACNPAFAYVFAQLLAAFWAPAGARVSAGQAWAIRLTIIAVVDATATFFCHYLMECAGQAWVDSLRVEALKRILAQPRAWFDKSRHSPGRIPECLDRNAEEMRNLVGRFVPIVLMVAGMVFASLIWALVISWKLTLVALSAGPALYAATQASSVVSVRWEAQCNAAAEATSDVMSEVFGNVRVVRALTLESYFGKKHAKSAEETFRLGIRRGLYAGFWYGLCQCISWWLTALVFYYATVLLTTHEKGSTGMVEIHAEDIVQVVNLLLFSMGTAAAMLGSIPQIAQAKATAIQLLVYATLSYNTSHEGRLGEGRRAISPFPVMMNDLQFSYPGKKEKVKVLRNISLRIGAGECVAIVGSSGCGKSTIANLLLRLYEPLTQDSAEQSGQQQPSSAIAKSRPSSVDACHHHSSRSFRAQRPAPPKYPAPSPLTFSHVPASELDTSLLRSLISYVPQSPFMFPATIRENIVYGLKDQSHLRALPNVVAAAKAAGIHDFIASLPDGYSTLIGEGGVGLSGGQMQRLSIARALIRRPKLLVMDEPTSSLDAESAEGVRACLTGLMSAAQGSKEMAVVVITHSKEMMRMAGRILVVDQGAVAEEGSYDELLARRGQFAELVGGGTWVQGSRRRDDEEWNCTTAVEQCDGLLEGAGAESDPEELQISLACEEALRRLEGASGHARNHR